MRSGATASVMPLSASASAVVPARNAAANSATELPSAFTVPRPVTTTCGALACISHQRVCRERGGPAPRDPGSGATALLGRDEIGERIDRRERFLPDLLVGDGDAEMFLDQHDQLEGVDRVEAETVDEDRLVVGDAGRGDVLQTQTRDQEVFQPALQIVGVRRHPMTSPPST